MENAGVSLMDHLLEIDILDKGRHSENVWEHEVSGERESALKILSFHGLLFQEITFESSS